MPGLFEQFPHTNFHELNLDWMIDLLNTFKDELENRAVLSVNGMTGEVTLYESENVVLPPLTDVSSWRLVRMMDGQYVGVLFQDGHVWLQQGNSTLKLLTTEDIPTSAGVVSINGLGGIVRLTGADIPIDDSADPDSVRLALETEHTERVNADNDLNNAIGSLNNKLHTTIVQTVDELITLVLANSICIARTSQTLTNVISGHSRVGLAICYTISSAYLGYICVDSDGNSYSGYIEVATQTATYHALQ